MDFRKDPYFAKSLKRSRSETYYKNAQVAMKLFMRFYNEVKDEEMTTEKLIQRKETDLKKRILDRGQVESEFLEWIEWLKEDYVNRRGKRGLSSNSIKAYASYIKRFFQTHGVELSPEADLPPSISRDRGRKENVKIIYRPGEVKKLLAVMHSNKDKAITLAIFQSGADLNTIFSLTYGDLKTALENSGPAVINVKRQKTVNLYKMCLGRDALQAIQLYITDKTMFRWWCSHCSSSWPEPRNSCPKCQQARIQHVVKKQKKELQYDDCIFSDDLAKESIANSKRYYSTRFRRYVLLAGLVTEEQLKRSDMNPGRPYGLRTAWRSLAEIHGIPESLAEFLVGHADKYGDAYRRLSDKEILDMYSPFEKHLSVTDIIELKDFQKTIEDLQRRVEELEEERKTRAEVIRGEHQEISLEAVLEIMRAVEADPKAKEYLKERLARRKLGS